MTRTYNKAKRAETQEETREKIVRATMALHLEQGVATTSYLDVAQRAGVGAATVYRHFPTMGSLVEACGTQYWQSIRPPGLEKAKALFAGHLSRSERVSRLVWELDAFYDRARAPLWSAFRDSDRVPQLAAFLADVRAAVAALVAEALEMDRGTSSVEIAAAVADFPTWLTLADICIDREVRTRIVTAMIDAAVTAVGPDTGISAKVRGPADR